MNSIDLATNIQHLVTQAMTVVKQEQVQVPDCLKLYVFLTCQRMILWHDDVELFVVEVNLFKGRHIGRQCHDGCINGAGAK